MDYANEIYEQLEMLIGAENAKKVFDYFSGSNIYFAQRIGLTEMHNKIYDELSGGATYATVAKKYGYTKTYIRKIEHKVRRRRRAERKSGNGVYRYTEKAVSISKPQKNHIENNFTGGLFDDID